MTDYVKGKVADFIERHDGKVIDLSGAYGPQSPDLIAAYIEHLTGKPWRFEYPAALDLASDEGDTMKDFERVTDWQLQTGDIAVYGPPVGIEHFGTLGILTGQNHMHGVEVFTQAPGPAGTASFPVSSILAVWRLKAGAECVALADRYAEQLRGDRWKIEGATPEVQALIKETLTDKIMRGIEQKAAERAAERMLHGYDPTCPPGDLTPYRNWLKQDDSDLPPIQPAVMTIPPGAPYPVGWLKKLGDQDMKPGDVALWDGVPDPRLGHVEIAQGRHYRHRPRGHGKTALLERWKALFGGSK